MTRIAIDLLWVRPNQVGGIESYIRNLLDGLTTLEDQFEAWLLVSKDNGKTFERYKEDSRFHIYKCEIESANVKNRILWQNFHLGKTIKGLGLDTCFEPYYAKPFLGTKGIKFITTIHDLQALHYPEYFSKGKVAWMKASWKNDVRTSDQIVAISHYVKDDIVANFKADSKKISVIYNPILIHKDDVLDFNIIKEKYGIDQKEYYFTVSSLLPHKNLETIVKVFKKINDEKMNIPCKWIISGVGGKSREPLKRFIHQSGLDGKVILTPFISNTERNTLYKNCKAFLFPSVFEGFGMPPVEAMYMGAPTITTRKTSLEEVTQGCAYYVDDPYSVQNWLENMSKIKKNKEAVKFEFYNSKVIAKKYLDIFQFASK